MVNKLQNSILLAVILCSSAASWAQQIQFPESYHTGVRPIDGQVPYGSSTPVMIPINSATQAGIYPSSGFGSPTFDPYSASQYSASQANASGYFPSNASPFGVYPTYSGSSQPLPSGTVGGVLPGPTTYTQPGVYPNSSPSGVYPNSAPSALYPGSSYGQPYGLPAYPNSSVMPPSMYGWNPEGTVFGNPYTQPEYLRFFQGPRLRHAWLLGNNDSDALEINDTDLSLGFAFPNFLYSTQPLYLMPSFSLHQWAGPRPPASADLPAIAYSAFLDTGWQSEAERIFGAELGLRVGMFSDFDSNTSDSLRVMGRAIARIRLTPALTMKLGAMYLDRNRVGLLPAGGFLWQPSPNCRADIFFPEPKLSHYLGTVGTTDSWWYLGGYYGGGAWTITRTDQSIDSIDINDIRIVLGFEWGRNEQIRQGRRVGFVEFGYVVDRELLYKDSPQDNLDLQDTLMIRAGIGY